MTITLERNIVEELVRYKLNNIQKIISSILDKWKEENIEDFITKAKTGELPNAEMDAIVVRQLNKNIEQLQKLLKRIKSRI